MAEIARLDIQVYDKTDKWEQCKYLVNGYSDLLWTNSSLDAANFILDSLNEISKLNPTIGKVEIDKVEEAEINTITLDQIISKIKEVIGKEQIFTIEFGSNHLCFRVYDSEVVIIYLAKSNDLYIDCELTEGKLDSEIVNELNQIMKLLDDNKELLRKFCD